MTSSSQRLKRSLSDQPAAVELLLKLEQSANKEYLTAFCELSSIVSSIDRFKRTYALEDSPKILNLDETVRLEEQLQNALVCLTPVVEQIADHVHTLQSVNSTSPKNSPTVKRKPVKRGNSFSGLRHKASKETYVEKFNLKKTPSNDTILTYLAPDSEKPRKVRKRQPAPEPSATEVFGFSQPS